MRKYLHVHTPSIHTGLNCRKTAALFKEGVSTVLETLVMAQHKEPLIWHWNQILTFVSNVF